MNLLSILLFITFLCFSQSIFAQTTTPEKQDPLKDSIDKYEKERLWAKILPFAEQWEAKLKKEKKESTADYGRALSSLGNALNRNGKSEEAEPLLLLKSTDPQKSPGRKPRGCCNGALLLGKIIL